MGSSSEYHRELSTARLLHYQSPNSSELGSEERSAKHHTGALGNPTETMKVNMNHETYINCMVTTDCTNQQSLKFNHSITRAKIFKERNLGRVAGPFESAPLENFACSPLRVVPKEQPGEYRLIHNLTTPKGQYVNEAIDGALCPVKYASLDQAIRMLQELVHGTLLVKSNIKSTFQLLPGHPDISTY
ncbi:hypothetical protein NDU88_005229 [Pleurodeles waltl]|uniref:Uncharacterized protein n=1 Tax=Pleurodeles waltl TaxID=8319 RepID=A0AAV7WY27_PLEWA|nr:hypothetical protein NDU88_005229 [Pleurodeles waltl]